MNKTPRSMFTKAFVTLNQLDKRGFRCWVFEPGMEFGSRNKWWQKGGSRTNPHEGLDIRCYADRQGKIVGLPAKTIVPAMFDGVVVRIFADFLGHSIMISHACRDGAMGLYSLYAHTEPTAALQRDEKVKAGEPIGVICSTGGSRVPPHLHLSVLLTRESVLDGFDWRTIHTAEDICLCDPRDFL